MRSSRAKSKIDPVGKGGRGDKIAVQWECSWIHSRLVVHKKLWSKQKCFLSIRPESLERGVLTEEIHRNHTSSGVSTWVKKARVNMFPANLKISPYRRTRYIPSPLVLVPMTP